MTTSKRNAGKGTIDPLVGAAIDHLREARMLLATVYFRRRVRGEFHSIIFLHKSNELILKAINKLDSNVRALAEGKAR